MPVCIITFSQQSCNVTGYPHYLLHCCQCCPSSNCISRYLASGGTSTDSTKLIRDPNFNTAVNLSPPYPAQKQKDHDTTYNNVHTRQTSHFHSPKHDTFKCNNIHNIKNKTLKFWTGLLQTTECPPSKHTAPDSLDEHLTSL